MLTISRVKFFLFPALINDDIVRLIPQHERAHRGRS